MSTRPPVRESIEAAHQRAPGLRVVLERPFDGELIVDNFAGGGGASTGLEAAIGRPADIAINHDAHAIAMHKANHPNTRHYQESVWKVDPREACAGRPVGAAWFSPDCTHFSRAAGRRPVSKEIRALAWVVVRWAKAVRPRVLFLENVPEFPTWGPCITDDQGDSYPDPERAGETFKLWLSKLEALGYRCEFKELTAANYGAPTTRKRFFMVARCDGGPIVWPEPSHERADWRGAASVIDWALPAPSIFLDAAGGKLANVRRPLAPATLHRVAVGIRRFVLEAQQPFIVRHGHYSKRTGAGLVEGRGAGLFRGQSLEDPLATICATNDKHLVCPILAKHYGGANGHQAYGKPITSPLGGITGRDSHALASAMIERSSPDNVDRAATVAAFLTKYNRTGLGQSVNDPLRTILTKDRFALVLVEGTEYRITDIGMRMLQPHELYAAQGFPADYDITTGPDGKRLTKTKQIKLVGNSVPPPVARALVAANVGRA